MNRFLRPVRDESWTSLAKVVFGVWLLVWAYASIHNQYLIRIQPEHFTVWHYRIPWTRNHSLLGVLYAFGALVTPGVILGICLYLARRVFERPKVSVGSILLSTVWVWLAVEICSPAAGTFVWQTRRGLYPDWLYPDDSRGLLTTQTIQITAYLTGSLFSVLLIAWTWRRRGPAPITGPPASRAQV